MTMNEYNHLLIEVFSIFFVSTASNNNITKNYNALLVQTIHCLNDVSPDNKTSITCTRNAVFFLRTFTQYFIENLNEQQLSEFLSAPLHYKQKVVPLFRQYIHFTNPTNDTIPVSSTLTNSTTSRGGSFLIISTIFHVSSF